MLISEKTKISALIKANPAAIETIASINPHFEKLRNPLLRKILASRVTIADAARIGKTSVDVFFNKLSEIGFEKEKQTTPTMNSSATAEVTIPDFLQNLASDKLVELDVREDILSGNDPFLKIMDAVDAIPEHGALCLINTFEPTPLIAILQKKGLLYHTQTESADFVKTYFYFNDISPATDQNLPSSASGSATENQPKDFDQLVQHFSGNLKEIDVRALEMPLPMVTILGELETLPPNQALYVHHKRIPQMLLPQLAERGFSHSIKEVGVGDVKMLVYKMNG